MADKQVQHLTFVSTLGVAGSATSGAKLTVLAPFAGVITQVDESLLQGPNGLVGVAVSHGGFQFLPRTQDAPYLYLNNVYAPFHPYEIVKGGEQITVDMNNGDGINTHTVTVVIKIEGEI